MLGSREQVHEPGARACKSGLVCLLVCWRADRQPVHVNFGDFLFFSPSFLAILVVGNGLECLRATSVFGGLTGCNSL